MAFSTAFNEVELSAVTSMPHEHVAFNWNVRNFKKLVDSAIDKEEAVLAKLPFNLVISTKLKIFLDLVKWSITYI